MKIETRYFGEVEIDITEAVRFSQPLYGFEKLEKYALLSDSTISDCFLWLQAIDDKDTCFILVDPSVLFYHYEPTLTPDMLRQVGCTKAEDVVIRLVAVIPENFNASTVNLKCPIVINTTGHCAAQVMLEDDYPIRAPLVEGGEEAPPC